MAWPNELILRTHYFNKGQIPQSTFLLLTCWTRHATVVDCVLESDAAVDEVPVLGVLPWKDTQWIPIAQSRYGC